MNFAASPPNGGSFADRLNWLLAGRKVTPWAQALGMSGSTISRLTKAGGIPPSADTLVRILRAENVSLSWLLDGIGAPFHLVRSCDDAETAELLGAELHDRGWNVSLLSDGVRDGLVLFQVVEVIEATGIQHLSMVAIAGPVGEGTNAVLRRHRGRVLNARAIAPATMIAIHEGRLGTWALLSAPDSVVRAREDMTVNEQVTLMGVLNEDRGVAAFGDWALSDNSVAMPPLQRVWPYLSKADREALRRVLMPFLERASRLKLDET